MKSPALICLELNEVIFPYVEEYIRLGKLEGFKELIQRYGVTTTVSEHLYAELEPWIQWVTVHTGLSYAEHQVFRLGDTTKTEIPQIWETLESSNVPVAAISPMNATNRTKKSTLFVPDPWTDTMASGGFITRRFHAALVQAVNDNARNSLSIMSLIWLTAGFAIFSRPFKWATYLKLAITSGYCPWRKAIFLDLLLEDLFWKFRKKAPDGFFSVFLNAAAHIQHHYLFSSRAYSGAMRNPDWYVADGYDPVFEVYEAYDSILSRMFKSCPSARLMVVTGLSQTPCSKPIFYWRLADHRNFLDLLGIKFKRVLPRMSRDFVIEFYAVEQAAQAAEFLNALRVDNKDKLFSVDNRGEDLFLSLTLDRDISSHSVLTYQGATLLEGLKSSLTFVALKNGQHTGIGYLIDTGNNSPTAQDQVPLGEVFERTVQHFSSGSKGIGR